MAVEAFRRADGTQQEVERRYAAAKAEVAAVYGEAA
jgi:hypothetical protein